MEFHGMTATHRWGLGSPGSPGPARSVSGHRSSKNPGTRAAASGRCSAIGDRLPVMRDSCAGRLGASPQGGTQRNFTE